MARIAGVNLPTQKRLEIGLTYIYGIGKSTSQKIIRELELDPEQKVRDLTDEEVTKLRSGQAVVGFLQPLIDPALAKTLADRGVTAISLDAIPRTLSRAQTMDALSSQANVGGYKAVLIAANAYPRYFPLLTTAAGTASQ